MVYFILLHMKPYHKVNFSYSYSFSSIIIIVIIYYTINS